MSTQMIPTKMTKQRLTQWMKSHYPYHSVQPMWEKFSSSTDLLESFQKIPIDLQKVVYLEIRHDMDPRPVGAYFNLALRAQKMYPDTFSWDVMRDYDLWNTERDFPTERSDYFYVLLEDFDNYCQAGEAESEWGRHYYMFAPMLLRAIHDEAIVIELFERCLETGIIPELTDIISLADNWENLREYPFEWALNIASTDDDSKSHRYSHTTAF